MRKSPYFTRSPRVKLALPTGKIIVHRPKAEPMEPKFSFETMIIPIFLTVATVGIMYYLSKTLYNSAMYAIFIMAMSIPMLGSYIATIVLFFRRKKKHRAEVAQIHEEYLQQLEVHRREIESIREQQTKFLREKDPNPEDCMRRIHDRHSSLWERAVYSEDFLHARIGLGTRPFKITVQLPMQDGYDIHPLIAEAQKLGTDYSEVTNVPVSIPLREKRVVGLVGERADVVELARVLALQLATHHSPEEVKIVCAYPEQESVDWNWMRWLPHMWDQDREFRYIAEGKRMAHDLFERMYSTLNFRKLRKSAEDKKEYHVPEFVFFLPQLSMFEDDALLPLLLRQGDTVGACTFLMSSKKETLPMECQLIIEVKDGVARLYETFSSDDKANSFTGREQVALDRFSLQEAREMARSIAPLRVKQSTAGVIPKVLTFLDMYQVNRVEELDVAARWEQNRYPLTLPVRIGVREGGKAVELNIHDKIEQNGHGPHGLMAGTTGSGKSEVIQSIILSLAATYHPHEMAFMLIDYKGGGMSNTFEGLPHVIATITNLEDPNLINRAKVSLRAELERRQKIFNMAGNIQHIDEYFRSDWRFREPLPHLLIVIDEFAQLKKDQPEFMDELISIAAIGRTLGVHLLLATQKPAGVVDEKIWSNSRFRICLRVQDDGDSREMIQIPNASTINVPGRAYFQVGNNEVLEYFQSAWSGASYQPEEETQAEQIEIAEIMLDGSTRRQKVIKTEGDSRRKQIQVIIDYMKEEAQKRSIKPLPGPWLEPLPERLPLSRMVDVQSWSRKGWEVEKDWLQPKIGIIDDVENQAQYPLRIDLNEGHFIAYGMPGSGKTTLIQSTMLSLFFGHAPADLYVYIIDFSRQMKEWARFPHVGGVVHEEETEKMRRLFRFLLKELVLRKEQFSNEGVSSLRSYRKITQQRVPALLLVIDGYQRFRTQFVEENEQLEVLLREGASYGIVVLVTANQTSDMYDRYRNNFVSAVSFELADQTDYYFAVGRPSFAVSSLPEGRGFVKGHNPPHAFQCMLPHDGADEWEKTAFFRHLADRMGMEWQGEPAKKIAMLPKEINWEQLLDRFPTKDSGALPYGIDTEDLSLQSIRLEDADHVLVTGRVESGKTSLLQTLILSINRQYNPEEIDVFLIELEAKRTGIMNFSHLPHVKGHATDLSGAKQVLEQAVSIIEEAQASTYGNDWTDSVEENSYRPLVIIIDDAENFMQQTNMDFESKSYLEKLTKEARKKNIHFLMAGSLASMNSYMHEPWMMNIKKKFVGFLLGSTLSTDLYFFNMRLPHAETDKELPTGDGFVIKGKHMKVKIAKPYKKAKL
ncbi:type VII secretion protein EssC [Aneurinibacillus aneurinilyticus]|jgi:S-DNA-T family DNA segregation ATPase FtsK/SpoIIIE|uniref:type VII secretion protein EssC n=1 Tax=Aneurinibacillus aneurinilyticus TaxID=1391 RepID=UPI0023F585D6|nr:type VII secretion protein EssC [Aneurinibacillus aneurinilyticus]MCI1696620.1 type VII secretion protein EssC [Aneurinibacillus aneurinilyticus]